MEVTQEKTLPVQLYGTSSLCFDKDDFMKADFSVDGFVRVQQGSGSGGLETLRDHLGVYLRVLRNAMIELINRDYADFVNLSTNLTGLDRLIEALKTPLGQLREEVLSVEKLMDEAIATTATDLQRRQTVTRQKALLHRLTQISTRLEGLEGLLHGGGAEEGADQLTGDLMDRLAAEVNHLNFLVSHCEGAALLTVFKPRVARVCQFVEGGLERGLREGISSRDEALLGRTLRTYASLGSLHHPHLLVSQLIRKQLEEVISDSVLRSDPRGLPGMYSNTVAAVSSVCQPLLAVTTGHRAVVRGYSFLECAAWPEVVRTLQTNTPHIFSPGNPDTFHQRYMETLEFLESFEKLLGTRERVLSLRAQPEYTTFLQLWNLPVYFQIRYQEVGQAVERGLGRGLDRDPELELFVYSGSQAVWEGLVTCFSPHVFLAPLLHRFWKLALLLLSRYRSWVTDQPQPGGKGSPSQSGESLSPDTGVGLVHDVQVMSQQLPHLFTNFIEPLVAHLPVDKISLIKDELNEQSEKLLGLVGRLSDVVVQGLVSGAGATLRQVADTPRLYRRTNRPLATTHQPYVATVTSALTAFSHQHSSKVQPQVWTQWLTQACAQLSQQYYTLTYDVLTSVHKMEESLKRLKRARDRGPTPGSQQTTGLSDDDKIRTQICLDVEHFGREMGSLTVDLASLDSYSALLKMVQEARDGKFVP